MKQEFNLSKKIISNHDMRYALSYLVEEGADIDGLIRTQDAKEFIKKIIEILDLYKDSEHPINEIIESMKDNLYTISGEKLI